MGATTERGDHEIRQITTSQGWERELAAAKTRSAQGDPHADASVRQAERNAVIWRERGR